MVAPNKSGKDKLASQPAVDKSRLQAAEETVKELEQFDAELAELKAKHDQYFLGLERFEPIKERESLKKRLNALRTSHIRNTGVKFRAQSLWQKYLSYERMWLRIAREIEDGTYSRDLFKARLRKEKRENKTEKKKGEAVELNEDELSAEGGDLQAALAEASASVEAKAREPKTDPELQAYVPSAEARPKTEGVPAAKPPPPPPAEAKKSGSFDLVKPAPSNVDAPPAQARPSSSFPAMKGPPPPPAEAKKSGTFEPLPPGAPDPRKQTVKLTGSFSVPQKPPPPPAPGAAEAKQSGTFPAMKGPPPPPPPAAAKPPAATSGVRPPPPPGASGARPARPPAPRPGGGSGALPDDKMRAIYNAYVAAKKQCKESTDGITYESVAKTINSQTPELIKQHNAKAVDFKVVIKNGKATLKAVPRT